MGAFRQFMFVGKQRLKLAAQNGSYTAAAYEFEQAAEILRRFPEKGKEAKELLKKVGLLNLKGFCESVLKRELFMAGLGRNTIFEKYSFASVEKARALAQIFRGERPFKPWKILGFVEFLKSNEPEFYRIYSKRLLALAKKLPAHGRAD